ncbi:hypothetical protein ACFJGW_06700 [Burkholderiaceae bacterium UC74_6]
MLLGTALMLMIGGSKSLMGSYTVPRGTAIVGWFATFVMGATVLFMFAMLAL